MKRFVDIRPAYISGYRFAFWCTVEDRFETFDGDAAWDTLEEFRESCAIAGASNSLVQRLEGLMGDWVHEPYDMMSDEREWKVVQSRGSD